MNEVLIKLLKMFAVFIILFITVLAIVKAEPQFSENDLTVDLVKEEASVAHVVVYDFDGISLSDVSIEVESHPQYLGESYITDIEKTIIDSHAILVSFDLEAVEDDNYGFHRELVVLNGKEKLNLGVSYDYFFIHTIKDFVDTPIKMGNRYYYVFYPLFWIFGLLMVVFIVIFYRWFL